MTIRFKRIPSTRYKGEGDGGKGTNLILDTKGDNF